MNDYLESGLEWTKKIIVRQNQPWPSRNNLWRGGWWQWELVVIPIENMPLKESGVNKRQTPSIDIQVNVVIVLCAFNGF